MEKEIDKLVISQKKLALLLEKRKNLIGRRILITSQISIGTTTITTLLVSDFKDFRYIKAEYIWGIFVIVTIIMFLGALKICLTDKYTHENLLKEIEDLSEVENEYRVLIVLRDEFEKYSNRFLVYYDTIWNCFLCPHYTYNPNDKENSEELIIKRIVNEIGIDKEDFTIAPICEKVSYKHSYRISDKKIYHFYYYKMNIQSNKFPSSMRKRNFEIKKRKYSWKTIDELRLDQNTMERNSDVVDFLEKHIWE